MSFPAKVLGDVQRVSPPATLVDVIERWAGENPDDPACWFVTAANPGGEMITFAQLHRRARQIAARLAEHVAPGERAVILCQPSIDYVAAFLGCLYAGVAAVPTYPPRLGRHPRALSNLRAIVADAQPAAALAGSSVTRLASRLRETAPEFRDMPFLELETVPAGGEGAEPVEAARRGETLAFLQYTSGSTSAPRGAMVSHANLLANQAMIQRGFEHTRECRAVIWLPPYHDMGLIGGILQPLYVGFPSILMAPATFLQTPLFWLQTIDRFRGTTSGAPNFAFELCVRATTPEQRAGLDLSTWDLAFVGAEPVDAATMQRFAEAFAPAGFSPGALYPCYGLAEATLIVSGGKKGEGARALTVDRAALEDGRVQPAEEGAHLTSCGQPIDQRVEIVTPEGEPAPAGAVGEIWIAGANVTGGYWRAAEATSEALQARLASGDGPFLRTGDLGFVHAGELYVAGRLKDLIIVRGRNFHPQDVERAAERSHEALRSGRSAAFELSGAGDARVALVAELGRDRRGLSLAGVAAAIRRAVASELDLRLDVVILTPPGAVPVTSSGKVQRAACRAALLHGSLEVLASSQLPTEPTGAPPAAYATPRDRVAYLRARISAVSAIPQDELDGELPLVALGLDSLQVMSLAAEVGAALGLSLPGGQWFEADCLADLERQLAAAEPAETSDAMPATSGPLTFTQEQLWLNEQLDPGNPAFNVVASADLCDVEPAALIDAVGQVVARHPAARTVYRLAKGSPLQVVLEQAPPACRLLNDSPEEALAYQRRRPFDLEHGPLLRADVVRLGPGRARLILASHHLTADGWSMGVLIREIAALAGGASLPTPAATMIGVAQRERALWPAAGSTNVRCDLASRLAGAPLAELPLDHGRCAPSGFRQERLRLALEAGLCARLAGLAKHSRCTPFTVLLSIFGVLLARCTGVDDIAVATPAAARHTPKLANVVGPLLNPIVVRLDLAGTPSFREMLGRARRALGAALARQDEPFGAAVQALPAGRQQELLERLRTMFALHDSRLPEPLAGPLLRSRAEQLGATQVDLFFAVEQVEHGGLELMLDYDARLFDAPTIERLARRFVLLAEGLTAEPDQPVSETVLEGAMPALVARPSPEVQPERPLPELISATAAQRPQSTAIECGGRALSYAELERRSNQLAHWLQRCGAGPEQLVGLLVNRSPEMVVALLGVLKAGAAYLPLDPAQPPARIAGLVAQAQPRLALSSGGCRASLPCENINLDGLSAELERMPPDPPSHAANADSLAYVIFTSGSSGTPKGVMVTQRGLSNVVQSLAREPGFGPDDVLLATTTLGFDIAAAELLVPLLAGGRVLVAPSDAVDVAEELATKRATVMQATPTLWRLLVSNGWQGWPGLRVWCGGEPLPRDLADALLSRCGELWNLYGPTETTIWSAMGRVGADGPIAVDQAVANTSLQVLDERLRPVAEGIAGQLHIGGAGLARGYLGSEELTRASFVPDPRSPGQRLYATGDRARVLSSGALQLLGRIDDQVKIRGHRVEPGEAAALLRRHAWVRDAAVVPRVRQGEPRLAAYVVALPGAPESLVAQLRAFVQSELPSWLAPSDFVLLDELPVSANGKLDRAALPDAAPSAAGGTTPAEGPTELLLARAWQDLLGVDEVAADANVFHLGAHSLHVARLTARLREQLGVALRASDVFDAPTIAALAARLSHLAAGTPPPPSSAGAELCGEAPAASGQRRLWLEQQREPAGSAYNLAVALDLEGPLDVEALRTALAALMARHEVLRTRLVMEDDELAQRIGDAPCLPAVRDVGDAEQARIETELARQPFDLSRGPLLRMQLSRLAPERHVLTLVAHHAILDGWSFDVLLEELAQLYAGAPLPPAQQFGEIARLEGEWLASDAGREQIAYWQERLTGAEPPELPADRPRSTLATFNGGAVRASLPPALLEHLRTLARQEDATLFMVLLAAYAALLARLGGQRDVVVGAVSAGRDDPRLARTVGFLANTLALRLEASPETPFRELLRQARRETLAALDHQRAPFEEVARVLPGGGSLVRTMLTLTEPPRAARLGSCHAVPRPLANGGAKFDFSLDVRPVVDGAECVAEFNSALFEPATAQRLLEAFRRLLAGVAAAPDAPAAAAGLLAPEDERLLAEWSGLARPGPDALVHELVAAQAARTPEATALVCRSERLTYAELERRATAIATFLRERGAGPETIVGVCLPSSIEAVVAMLGVLKAGAAFLPLAPGDPAPRLAAVLASAKPALVLANDSEVAGAPAVDVRTLEMGPGEPRESTVRPDELAYVLYTSGSSGTPKGVMVTHRALASYLTWAVAAYDLAGGAGAPVHTSLCFDLTFTALFGPLLAGRTAFLVPEEAGPEGLLTLAPDAPFSLVKITPSHLPLLEQLLEPARAASWTRRLVIGGEALHGEQLGFWRRHAPDTVICNEYGPTETVVGVCLHEARAGDVAPGPAPIGRPIANVAAYVLDESGQRLPPGMAGELCIGGAQVARGYLGQPDLTAASFQPDPYGPAGSRLYRTGDRARWNASGQLEFLGRRDRQVKLRGVRVELGEVEAALLAAAGVRQAAAVIREDQPGERRLVAYLAGEGLRPAAVRAWAAERLPAVMVPSACVALDELPLTRNGKVDLAALPAPPPPDAAGADERPLGELEATLAALWAEVLGLPRVGPRDDFFQLGGHSMLAAKLAARLTSTLDRPVPLTAVFMAPTVEAFAASIAGTGPGGAAHSPLAVQLTSRPAGRTLFWVGPIVGSLAICSDLAGCLDGRLALQGLHAPGLDGRVRPARDIEELALALLAAVQSIQPEGPYLLGGWSFGGMVAYEMARLLPRLGGQAERVFLVDARAPAHRTYRRGAARGLLAAGMRTAQGGGWRQARLRALLDVFAPELAKDDLAGSPELRPMLDVFEANLEALRGATPQPFGGPVTLFVTAPTVREAGGDETLGWGKLASDLTIAGIGGDHHTALSRPYVEAIADRLAS